MQSLMLENNTTLVHRNKVKRNTCLFRLAQWNHQWGAGNTACERKLHITRRRGWLSALKRPNWLSAFEKAQLIVFEKDQLIVCLWESPADCLWKSPTDCLVCPWESPTDCLWEAQLIALEKALLIAIIEKAQLIAFEKALLIAVFEKAQLNVTL